MNISNNLKEKLKIYKGNSDNGIDIEVNHKDKSLSIVLDTFAFSINSLTNDVIKFFNDRNFECSNTNKSINKHPILYLEGNNFTLHMRFAGGAYFGASQYVLLKLIS